MRTLHIFTLASTSRAFFDGQFKYLVENGHHIDLACSEDNLVQEFAARNKICYLPVEIARTLSPKQDVKTIRKLVSLIKKGRYDVVVGHTPKGALLGMIAAFLARIPKRVYIRHGVVYTTAKGLKRFILKSEEKFVSALSTKIVNVSPSLGQLAVRDRLNSKAKQTLFGSGTCGGIDTQKRYNPALIIPSQLEALRNNLGLSEKDFVVGFAGRLCKDKGIMELIDGFNLFKQEHKDIPLKLLLVGGYDGRDLLPQSVHQTIQEDTDIIYAGSIPQDQMPLYYALMDVFVFPSHREGFGMSVIEAQAMGRPALVARSHGCIDTIRDGITGSYINLTPRSIADTILSYVDKDVRLKRGKEGRKFVCETFDHSILWPQILEFYNNL